MAEQAIVRCPFCSQKYRVSASLVGHTARCKVCRASFVVGENPQLDDDTVVSWIAEEDPVSDSVLGSTGLFHRTGEHPAVSADTPARPADAAPRPTGPPPTSWMAAGTVVRLAGIEDEGAVFEFPVAALANENLRNAFPHRCVGCGTRQHLQVHLICWPERLCGHETARWREFQNTPVGTLDAMRHGSARAFLASLPPSRHTNPPFSLPFPIFVCKQCHAADEVRAHVSGPEGGGLCRLTIASLSIAVEFFRSVGGRDTPEYHRLVEQRDMRHDTWHSLHADVRHRISQWFEALPGERFVGFFRDADFSITETGVAGAVLTNRRLVFRKYAAYRDYPLHEHCRVEIRPRGDRTLVQIFEEGHRPAVFTLTTNDGNQLATALRELGSAWTITR